MEHTINNLVWHTIVETDQSTWPPIDVDVVFYIDGGDHPIVHFGKRSMTKWITIYSPYESNFQMGDYTHWAYLNLPEV